MCRLCCARVLYFSLAVDDAKVYCVAMCCVGMCVLVVSCTCVIFLSCCG